MEPVMCGVNHRSSPVELRERLALDRQATEAWLASAAGRSTLSELVILSTCNRTEIYAVSAGEAEGLDEVRRLLQELAGTVRIADEHLYTRTGTDAAAHAMRVASGLDSLVIGERQILGQLKDAYAMARAAGRVGAILDRMFTTVLHAAKRVHTETAVGSGAVSVASAAIVLAEKVLGALGGRKVVVVGAGETGTLVARHVAKHRPAALLIVNRTIGRAQALAHEVGGRAMAMEALADALDEADVVVCATRATEHVITANMIDKALARRQGRPLVLVDIAMPRNVAPETAEADNVFVYPLDALSVVVDQSLARRQRETARAEAIIDEEVGRFAEWLRSQAALPLLRELQAHFERVRADEVRRSQKHFRPEELPHVEQLTRSLVNKLLHAPTVHLKQVDPESSSGLCWADTVRGLFSLGASRQRGGSDGAC
jgi:glutamyl-tRNA reductase